MNETELQSLFNKTTEKDMGIETKNEIFNTIIESIEKTEGFDQQESLLKIYILSTGRLFLNSGTPWSMAEKSIKAAETYMLVHPLDYDVNSIYLLLTNLIFKYEQSYQKAMELYSSNNVKLKKLALTFLQGYDFYHEGLITKNEYEKYCAEHQNYIQSALPDEV